MLLPIFSLLVNFPLIRLENCRNNSELLEINGIERSANQFLIQYWDTKKNWVKVEFFLEEI